MKLKLFIMILALMGWHGGDHHGGGGYRHERIPWAGPTSPVCLSPGFPFEYCIGYGVPLSNFHLVGTIWMSQGSGTLINMNGDILTADHVIHDAHNITVKINGNSYPATVLINDATHDVAILHIKYTSSQFYGFNPYPAIGDSLTIKGWAPANHDPFAPTVRYLSYGRLTSVARWTCFGFKSVGLAKSIPGTSGGPVLTHGLIDGIVLGNCDWSYIYTGASEITNVLDSYGIQYYNTSNTTSNESIVEIEGVANNQHGGGD